MSKIAVIVPIYNTEMYLRKCVDSIISQTYKNLEIILVDDGSTDNSPEICDNYARIDSRVKVIHKKNGGLSDARNAGLNYARGEYVAFIDSDDYIDGNYIKVLLENAMQGDCDVTVCGHYKVYDSYYLASQQVIENKRLTNIDAMRDVFSTNSLCDIMTCNKLYRRKLFIDNDILFPVGKIHEDNFTVYKLLYYANSVMFFRQPLYYYVQRPGSIMDARLKNIRPDIIEAADEAADWVQYHNLPLFDEVQAYQLVARINLLNIMVDNKAIDDALWDKLTKWIFRHRSAILSNDCVDFKYKVMVYTLMSGKRLFLTARKFYRLIPRNTRNRKIYVAD